MNILRLKKLKGEEKLATAICIHRTIKKFNPPVSNAGTVATTPFQKELRLKIGAKVMMTYNVDTTDGLTNGARGELLGIIEDDKEHISKLIIKFEEEANGREKRRQSPEISIRYPGGTAIERVNFPFSISKSKKSVINTGNVIQFPIKLAFAVTAHKIQGATVPKPSKVIIDVTDIFQAAMLYVMLSRVCTLAQIFILDRFEETKMYPSNIALTELNRLDDISKNRKLSKWETEENGLMKIISLNCRSLMKHHCDIIVDASLLKSDIICLQETWLNDDICEDDLEIPGYNVHLNSKGKGKGIAIYFKKETFKIEKCINKESMQLSKFTSPLIDIIAIYRSQHGDMMEFKENIEQLINGEKAELILGDFNFCFMSSSSNPVGNFLKQNNFLQLIKEPTHIEGNLLDQAHLRDTKQVLEYSAELHSKYYTDHKALAIMVKMGRNLKELNTTQENCSR